VIKTEIGEFVDIETAQIEGEKYGMRLAKNGIIKMWRCFMLEFICGFMTMEVSEKLDTF